MEFIHFVNKSALNIIKNNGIEVESSYRGPVILIFPLIRINFKSPSHAFRLQAIKNNLNLSIVESWERIGALEIRQNNEKVYGAIFSLNAEFYPMKVNIDISSSIAKKFVKKIDMLDSSLVIYDCDKSLSEVVANSSWKKYTIEAKFEVKSEIGLLALLECFKKSGGGIWGALSIYCLISKNIEEKFIKEIVDF
ncbi:hypothetical protein AR687_14790 [Flavobacteriaceae bacterium CRH]|nr:hypothetical protein AR687_14790 [Flavobacteriaceae bacterium CRH]